MLYKYKSIDEYSKKIISDGELFLPSVDKLNDPYEGAIPFRFSLKDMSCENIFAKILECVQRDNPTKSFEENYKIASEEFSKGTYQDENHIKIAVEDTKKRIKEQFGIYSLTRDKNNYLMWSHYANSHKGFCIGFDKRILTDTIGGVIGPVLYGKKMPEFSIADSNENLIKLLFTKSEIWNYEQEVRITKINAANQVFNIPLKTGIKEIILGCCFDESLHRTFIDEIRSNIGCPIFKTVVSDSAFSLEIKEI